MALVFELDGEDEDPVMKYAAIVSELRPSLKERRDWAVDLDFKRVYSALSTHLVAFDEIVESQWIAVPNYKSTQFRHFSEECPSIDRGEVVGGRDLLITFFRGSQDVLVEGEEMFLGLRKEMLERLDDVLGRSEGTGWITVLVHN